MSEAFTQQSSTKLPVGAPGRIGVAWWGMLCVIATEGALFAYLLFSYYYLALQNGSQFLPAGTPSLQLALPNTVVLLATSVAVWWAGRTLRQGQRRKQLLGIGLGIILGVVFVLVQLLEWRGLQYSPTSSEYGSVYFTLTGFHLAHVVAGIVLLLVVLVWSILGYIDARRNTSLLIATAYWFFVDIVWLAVFFTLYVTPLLG